MDTDKIRLSDAQVARFRDDGFLVVERLIDPALAARAAARFEPLFRGEYETGIVPDDAAWGEGMGGAAHNRQLSNAWKSDRTIASVALREEIGLWCAQLGGWPGARTHQHDLVWKVPGSREVKMHQDCPYNSWVVPQEFVACWIALTDTSADAGTICYARGSHKWGEFVDMGAEWYGVGDYQGAMRAAAKQAGVEAPEVVPVEVPAGGGAFHSGWTFHGSPANRNAGADRRALATHCCSSQAHFHPERRAHGMGSVFCRYQKFGDDTMEESFFPILWTEDGGRSAFLDDYIRQGSAAGAA